jgi:DNA modification methylase
MKLETLRLTDLVSDPNNARKHDEKNLAAIKGSLNQFGQRKPIVIQGSTVIAGNGTLEAARQLGWDEIQVVRVPEDWTADQAKAFALADNRTAELATWDNAVLQQQLSELENAGLTVQDFGFEASEVPLIDVETFEDELPELTDNPVTQLGDLYRLGNHYLICGDSTDPKNLALALQGNKADCVFTDPPYNVAYEGGTKDKLTIKNDEMSDEEFNKFLLAFYEAALENTKAGGAIYVCYPGEHISNGAFGMQLTKAGWMLKQVLIWVKDALVLSRQDYNWQHEAILYGWKPGAAHTWYGPYSNTTVLDDAKETLGKKSKEELIDFLTEAFQSSTILREKRPRRNDIHPTMKPVNLVARMLKNSMAKNQLVLDPFGGSGSTLIAAEQLGLRAALCELDPKYCDAIIKRWENLTGEKAELL